jgi:hypothetical protein
VRVAESSEEEEEGGEGGKEEEEEVLGVVVVARVAGWEGFIDTKKWMMFRIDSEVEQDVAGFRG